MVPRYIHLASCGTWLGKRERVVFSASVTKVDLFRMRLLARCSAQSIVVRPADGFMPTNCGDEVVPAQLCIHVCGRLHVAPGPLSARNDATLEFASSTPSRERTDSMVWPAAWAARAVPAGTPATVRMFAKLASKRTSAVYRLTPSVARVPSTQGPQNPATHEHRLQWTPIALCLSSLALAHSLSALIASATSIASPGPCTRAGPPRHRVALSRLCASQFTRRSVARAAGSMSVDAEEYHAKWEGMWGTGDGVKPGQVRVAVLS